MQPACHHRCGTKDGSRSRRRYSLVTRNAVVGGGAAGSLIEVPLQLQPRRFIRRWRRIRWTRKLGRWEECGDARAALEQPLAELTLTLPPSLVAIRALTRYNP